MHHIRVMKDIKLEKKDLLETRIIYKKDLD
jgi:hypothetical protein